MVDPIWAHLDQGAPSRRRSFLSRTSLLPFDHPCTLTLLGYIEMDPFWVFLILCQLYTNGGSLWDEGLVVGTLIELRTKNLSASFKHAFSHDKLGWTR